MDRGVFATLPAHEGIVTCVAFVRDRLLVTADDKGMLKLWKGGDVPDQASSRYFRHKLEDADQCDYISVAVACKRTGAQEWHLLPSGLQRTDCDRWIRRLCQSVDNL